MGEAARMRSDPLDLAGLSTGGASDRPISLSLFLQKQHSRGVGVPLPQAPDDRRGRGRARADSLLRACTIRSSDRQWRCRRADDGNVAGRLNPRMSIAPALEPVSLAAEEIRRSRLPAAATPATTTASQLKWSNVRVICHDTTASNAGTLNRLRP